MEVAPSAEVELGLAEVDSVVSFVGEIRPLSDHIDEPADLGMVACARPYAGEFDKAQKAEALPDDRVW
jgi:hypothetical protein